jgi:hypothetical protein
MIALSAASLLARRWRIAIAGFTAGATITAVGHAAEGNLASALRDLARHPIWSVRADAGLALEIIAERR